MGTQAERPINPNEPLWVKLEEEWLAMAMAIRKDSHPSHRSQHMDDHMDDYMARGQMQDHGKWICGLCLPSSKFYIIENEAIDMVKYVCHPCRNLGVMEPLRAAGRRLVKR